MLDQAQIRFSRRESTLSYSYFSTMLAMTAILHFSAAKLHNFSFEIAHYFNFNYNSDNLVIIYSYFVLKFIFWKLDQLNFMNYVIILYVVKFSGLLKPLKYICAQHILWLSIKYLYFSLFSYKTLYVIASL